MKIRSPRIMMFVLMGVFFLGIFSVFAETIVLKSGERIEGKIVEQTDDYVKVDSKGVPIMYFIVDIDSINGITMPKTVEDYLTRKGYVQEGVLIKDLDKATASKLLDKFGKEKVDEFVSKHQERVLENMRKNSATQSNSNAESAEEYFNRGLAVSKQGNLPQAISDFTKAIEINPNLADAYYGRGIVYGEQGNFTQAISDCTKAIAINPNLADAYFSRGLAYRKQGNLPQAISDCTKAIAINPNLADAYYGRGIVYCEQGNFTQAISDYTKAIEIKPNDAKVYHLRGFAYYNEKEYDKAWADVHKAEKLGYKINSQFLEDLKKASGRGK